MSKTIDPNLPDSSSSSTIKNLYRQNSPSEPYKDNAEKTGSGEYIYSKTPLHHKNSDDPVSGDIMSGSPGRFEYDDADDVSSVYGEVETGSDDSFVEKDVSSTKTEAGKKEKRFGKFKEAFDRLINALKQQPENVDYDDEPDDIFNENDIDADLDSAKEIYKTGKNKNSVDYHKAKKDRDQEEIRAVISKALNNAETVSPLPDIQNNDKAVKATNNDKAIDTDISSQKDSPSAPESNQKSSITVKVAKISSDSGVDNKTTPDNSHKQSSIPDKTVRVEKDSGNDVNKNALEKSAETSRPAEVQTADRTLDKEVRPAVTVKVEKSAETSRPVEAQAADKAPDKEVRPAVTVKVEKAAEPSRPVEAQDADKMTENETGTADHNTPEVKASEYDISQYNTSNLIYSAPKATSEQQVAHKSDSKNKAVKDSSQAQGVNIIPPKAKTERHKKELPVFDIFEEYAKEQQAKQQKAATPSKVTNTEAASSKDNSSDNFRNNVNNEPASRTVYPIISADPEIEKSDHTLDTGNNAEKTIADTPSDHKHMTVNNTSGNDNPVTANVNEEPIVDLQTKTGVKEKSLVNMQEETCVKEKENTSSIQENDVKECDITDDQKESDPQNTAPFTDIDNDKNRASINKAVSKTPVTNRYNTESIRLNSDDIADVDGMRATPRTLQEAYDVPGTSHPATDDQHTSPENVDLTECSSPTVTYHYSYAAPFIVMAGKFTKTLRGEYESIMIYRNQVNKKASGSNSNIREHKSVSDIQQRKSSAPSKPVVMPEIKSEKKPAPQWATTVKTPYGGVRKTVREVNPVQRDAKPPLSSLINSNEKPSEINNSTDYSSVKKHSYNEKQGRSSKPLKLEKRKKQKFDFRSLFNSEEEYDPEDDTAVEDIKPQLDDYTEEKDADAINTEITTTFQTVLARALILTATTVLSVILSLLAQCTPLFRESIRNGWLWYAIISFLLLAVSATVYRIPIVNGLISLRRLKGNPDTAIAVASVAVAIQSVTSLFTPNTFINGTLHIYVPILLIAMLLNAFGKLLILTRTHRNFAFLRKPFPKFAGKIWEDAKVAKDMAEEFPSHKTYIGYTRRSNFMSNFLQISYHPDPSEESASRIAPFTTALSLICCLIYGIVYRDFAGAVSTFALTACMSIPMICLLAINIPLRRLCQSVLKSGAMITGYETVKQFCDTNAIVVDSSQLYPKGSVTLSGMKAFKQSKLNDAILAGAAIMYVVNGNMTHVFENIVQCKKDALPVVENVIYEDNKGLVGWVKDQRILIGNRDLLESHNIKPPEKELEERYTRMGNDIIYISVGGELIAMFILSYKTDRIIARELRALEQNGVSLIIRTIDPNITKEKIAERFGLFHRCITVLPTGLGNIYHAETATPDERSRAYLVTRGKLSSFAKAVSGCIKLKSNATITRILQYIAMVLGLSLVALIIFVSGFEKLGCLEMFIYSGFWIITTLIVSMIRK